MIVVEVRSTRAGRPRRWVDLLPVLTEGPFATSMATRAQNIVELYGVLPTVSDDVDLKGFPSKGCFAARSPGLACPLDCMGRA